MKSLEEQSDIVIPVLEGNNIKDIQEDAKRNIEAGNYALAIDSTGKEIGKCYNNDSNIGNVYGRLYTFAEAKEFCPNEWRLPSKEDWELLVSAAGGYDISGSKLKARVGWAENRNGVDEFDFAALPSGICFGGERFCNLNYKCVWWSSAEINEYIAYSRGIDFSGNYTFIGKDPKKNLLSVRYVKDL